MPKVKIEDINLAGARGQLENEAEEDLPGNGRYIVDEREDEIILHKVGAGLKKLYIEPTSSCNLQCITCVRQQWPELADNEMSMELFEDLLNQMKKFPQLKRVHLGGFGEPLAHSQALEIIRRLCEAGYQVSINTNGTLVNEETAATLINAGLHSIFFSIDAVDEDIFRKIRVNGDLDQVTGNMLRLRKMKEDLQTFQPKIGLEFVLMRGNMDQLSLLPKLAKEAGSPTVLVTNLLAYSDEMYKEVLYEKPGLDRSLGIGVMAPLGWDREAAQHNLPEPAVWPAVEKDYVLLGSVRMPRMYWGSSRRCGFINDDAAVIRWDGSVSPCYGLMNSYNYRLDNRQKEVSSYLLGNVAEESLYEIWNKPEYVKFRYRVRNYNFPSCMDCSTNQNCDYTEANEDCWGNSPSCADCLWSQGIVRCP